MLTPSSGTLADYNSAVLGGNATHVRIVFPVQNKTFTDGDIAMDGGLAITQLLNPDTDLTMGKAVSSEIVICFLNNGQFSGFDWAEEFHVDFGVDIGGTTNWVTVGYFKGKKPERITRTEIIEFTAQDRMLLFDVLADDFIGNLSFPISMSQIYSALCTYVGISKVSGNERANAMAMSYLENPFPTGITCRQILAWIAEANGCYAKIDANGNAKLYWFTDQSSAYSLTGDDYFDIDINETTAPVIDSVRISSSEEDTTGFIYPVGGNNVIYQIIDNPLIWVLTTGNRTAVLDDMVTRFAAFGTYTPCSVNAVGNWMVEVGDIIEVGYDGNQTMNMPIFSRTIHWNGGCVDGYECTGKAIRDTMTESAKEQYATGGKLSNKYTIVSGVDITDEGVSITGGKFVKIISGGSFYVECPQMLINSDRGYMYTKTTRTDYGITYPLFLGFGTTMSTTIPYVSTDLKTYTYQKYINNVACQASEVLISHTNYLVTQPLMQYTTELSIGCKTIDGVYRPCISGSGQIREYSDENGTLANWEADKGYLYFDYLYLDKKIEAKSYGGDGVANNLTTSDPGYVLDARQAINLAQSIQLTSTDTTWALIWAKINNLVNGKPAVIFIHANAIGTLTDSNITAGAWSGTITRTSSGAFSLMIRSAGGQVRTGTISGASSSSVGTWEDIRYASFSDALLVNSLGNINNNSKVVKNNGTSTVRCLLIGSSSASSREFMFMCVIPTSGGNHYATQIYKGSNITISAASTGITITTSASSATAVYAVSFAGNANNLSMS